MTAYNTEPTEYDKRQSTAANDSREFEPDIVPNDFYDDDSEEDHDSSHIDDNSDNELKGHILQVRSNIF